MALFERYGYIWPHCRRFSHLKSGTMTELTFCVLDFRNSKSGQAFRHDSGSNGMQVVVISVVLRSLGLSVPANAIVGFFSSCAASEMLDLTVDEKTSIINSHSLVSQYCI